MNVRCGGCGKNYRVDDARLEGKTRVRLRCTACQAAFEISVPGSEAASPPVAAAPPATAAPEEPPQRVTEARPATSGETAGEAEEMVAAASPGTTQTVREGELLSGSGKLRVGVPELPEGRRVSLAVLTGPDQGKMIPVERPRMVIGRSEADVVVGDPEISRRHAVIEIYGDRFVVRDLNSTNGTFVGDRKITAEELENQEEFRIGTSRMMFIMTTPE